MIEVTDVTGAKINVQYTRANQLRIAEARVDELPMAFADLPVFRELGLEDRPAILLGLDVMQLFRRVSIDFATRRVQLLPHDAGQDGPIGSNDLLGRSARR
jgi:hypothetical protein